LSLLAITLANVVMVLLASFIVGRTRDELRSETRRSRWVAWQLRQLVPPAQSAAP